MFVHIYNITILLSWNVSLFAVKITYAQMLTCLVILCNAVVCVCTVESSSCCQYTQK